MIAGLLDNQSTENFSKVPGIGSIPILGKLFQSKTISRTNSELLVIITPEIVRPFPSGQTAPELTFKSPFLPSNSNIVPIQPGLDKTGPVPVKPAVESLPFERLVQKEKQQGQTPLAPGAPMVPPPGTNQTPVPPAGSGGNGQNPPAATSGSGGSGN